MPATQSPQSEELLPKGLPPVEEHPDVALVARAKAGDSAAFEKLVKHYDRQIFASPSTSPRTARTPKTSPRTSSSRPTRSSSSSRAQQILYLARPHRVNESLMRLRKRKTSKTVSMDEDVHTEEGSIPRDFAEWRPNPEQLYGQVRALRDFAQDHPGPSPRFRTVFTLRDIENLSTEETADALGLSVPAVKSRLLRARLQLRERLSRYFRQANPLQALESKSR